MTANPEPETLADRLESCCTEAVEVLTNGIAVENLAKLLAIRHDITNQEAADQIETAKAITANLHSGAK
jgi:hypothetical protein